MKAFVIKNKEGKYLQYFTDMYRFDFTDRLINAMFYEQWEQDSINYALKTIPDCDKVVEITIAEGDLEQQLAEKDKEIEKLKNFMSKWHFENFESFENHYNYLMSLKNREQLMVENEAMKETIANLLGQKKTSSKEICKQVCNEIREKLPYYEYSFQEPEVPRVDVIEIKDIEFILDKIEQGEHK